MEDLMQNLEDAGCGAETIAEVCRLCRRGQTAGAVRLLRQHRRGLMDRLHESQKRVDCLDYLVWRIEKEAQSAEKGGTTLWKIL